MNGFERYQLKLATGGADESRKAVVFAFAANALVALAKTGAAVVTRSPALAAEAVHSWVDTGNEVFVVAASRTANRPADPEHPLGYGRESYVWSLFASLGTLLLGAVVTVWHGVQSLGEPAAHEGFAVGYAVIAFSLVLEGLSFRQAYLQVRALAERRGRSTFAQARLTSNSPLRAVFAEDLTALLGLGVALVGMGLHQLTGDGRYDAGAAIVIGLILGVAAMRLLNANRRFLEGKALTAAQRAEAIALLRAMPEVARVSFLYAEFIGPDRVMLVAGVALQGSHDQAGAAYLLRALEQRVRAHENVGLAVLTLAAPDDDDAR
jgi:cation diffusion facilitator family transporter